MWVFQHICFALIAAINSVNLAKSKNSILMTSGFKSESCFEYLACFTVPCKNNFFNCCLLSPKELSKHSRNRQVFHEWNRRLSSNLLLHLLLEKHSQSLLSFLLGFSYILEFAELSQINAEVNLSSKSPSCLLLSDNNPDHLMGYMVESHKGLEERKRHGLIVLLRRLFKSISKLFHLEVSLYLF